MYIGFLNGHFSACREWGKLDAVRRDRGKQGEMRLLALPRSDAQLPGADAESEKLNPYHE
jgi:hypothetical protein